MSENAIIENPFATHGAVSWHELLASDVEAAKAFYSAAFGWTFEEMALPAANGSESADCGVYTCIVVAGAKIGGMVKSPMPDAPPMWSSYVTVDDVERVKATVEGKGATVLWGIRQVPGVGKMFGFKDGQGAVINAIQYAPGHGC